MNARADGFACTRRVTLVACLALAALRLPAVPAANGSGARFDADADIAFPQAETVVDVTRPPYNAKGDGVTDDTIALQSALSDTMGLHKVVYLPNGTYLVSGTLKWSKRNTKGNEAWGFNWIQGQNPLKTVIRLKDGTFPAPGQGGPIMWCGGFGSADWFHNYIQDVTFSVGRNNAGASGLSFYSNNTGGLRQVRIVSEDGGAAVGLDLGNNMNGPLLVRNVAVHGFATGIRCACGVNSQTFEHISLIDQAQAGLVNDGQSIAIRGLHSENAVPALVLRSTTTLLDARLVGTAAAAGRSAVQVSKGVPFLGRDVAATGYATAVAVEGGANAATPFVREFMTGTPNSPFGAPAQSLRLPVEETPEVPWDPPASWAVVTVPDGADAAPLLQRAVDSGAATVFLATEQKVVLRSPVTIRGRVRRILGTGSEPDYLSASKPDFIVADGVAPVIVFEHFGNINGGIQIDTDRTVVLRSVSTRLACRGKGKLFLEDFGSWDLRPNTGQAVWARQLNIENEGTHLTNDGGDLWVLGYKTERGGTLLHTTAGGRSELFGNFSYTTTAGALAPMFVTEDSSVFAHFHETCFNANPFAVLVRETRGGETRLVRRGEGWIAPYVGVAPAAGTTEDRL